MAGTTGATSLASTNDGSDSSAKSPTTQVVLSAPHCTEALNDESKMNIVYRRCPSQVGHIKDDGKGVMSRDEDEV